MLVEFNYEFDHKLKVGLAWKIDLKKAVIVDGKESTCKIF